MRKSVLPPDYRTRDALAARLRDLQPRLELAGVRHAAFFGSVARGDDVPESDVDVVVDIDPSRNFGVFDFVAVGEFLREALGRPVDLKTKTSLRPGRHDDIIADLFEVF
jgi:predicted nucleotidyltransferase